MNLVSDMLDKEIIHGQGGTELNGMRVHCATQSHVQLETRQLFISGIFHLTFSGLGRLWVTEAGDKGGYCMEETCLQGLWFYKMINFASLSRAFLSKTDI